MLPKDILVRQPAETKTRLINPYEFYSLNVPGIPFLALGERSVTTDLAKEKSSDKLRPVTRERFFNLPVSNLVYHRLNGDWVNGSWVCQVLGGDKEIFKLLDQAGQATMRFLALDEPLQQLSGVNKMVEIGVNVGGDEIVFKRILLPKIYTDNVNQQELIYRFEGMKMPDVFISLWQQLQVDQFDAAWHERVMKHLVGNVRNIDRGVEYMVNNGELWTSDGIWRGLLYDRRGIEAYLVEEQALVNLKPGEYLVTKYSHGGGAISAVTAGEREKDKPFVVGDIQMMGKDGKIHQMAVEGEPEVIDGLIEAKVAAMLKEPGMEIPIPMPMPVPVGPVELPVHEFRTLDKNTFEVSADFTSEVKEVYSLMPVTEKGVEPVAAAVAAAVAADEIKATDQMVVVAEPKIIEGSDRLEADLPTGEPPESGWWGGEMSFDVDDIVPETDGGDEPVPPGGGGRARLPVTVWQRVDSEPAESVANQPALVEREPRTVEDLVAISPRRSPRQLAGPPSEVDSGKTAQPALVEREPRTVEDLVVISLVDNIARVVVEPPVWSMSLQGLSGEAIPEFDVSSYLMMAADDLVDWAWIIVTTFQAILRTNSQRIEVVSGGVGALT